uniref:LRAT domain-containing protein n=1 Tax=Anguilla anguilla TaxID=7936 RepID=A0A0E9UGX6_ANGAN
MSNDWKIFETKDFNGSKTVSDFVKAGGTDYSLIFNNCHDGAGRMMDQ